MRERVNDGRATNNCQSFTGFSVYLVDMEVVMEVDFWKCFSLILVVLSLIVCVTGNTNGAILCMLTALYFVEASK